MLPHYNALSNHTAITVSLETHKDKYNHQQSDRMLQVSNELLNIDSVVLLIFFKTQHYMCRCNAKSQATKGE